MLGKFEGFPIQLKAAEFVTFVKATKLLMDSEMEKLNRSQLSKISYTNMQLS